MKTIEDGEEALLTLTTASAAPDPSLEAEPAFSTETLQYLKELGPDGGDSFLLELLETFEQDAVAHLAALQSAIASGERGRIGRVSHSLKGSCLSIGAQSMAAICQRLENPGAGSSLVSETCELARLEREFARVQRAIQKGMH